MLRFIGLVGLFVAVAVDTCCSFLLADQCTCSNVGNGNGYVVKTYNKTDNSVDVVNPGRGFYIHSETNTSQFNPIEDWMMDGTKKNVLLRTYYLTSYVTQDLDTDFTDKVKADLEKVKSLGWTVILRFAYTKETDGSDARLTQVLQHIGMLDTQNVFREYEGYITAIQAGFIGAWGEWHYSNNDFGIPGPCTSSSFSLTAAQWHAREQVLTALLKAAPKSIEICVRIPAFKYHMFDKSPTTQQEDEDFTDKSRIAFHDDAFLYGEDDRSTFLCPNKAHPTDDKNYAANDSVYNVVTGETNAHPNTSYYSCDTARREMKKYHYSILNCCFNVHVIKNWNDDHCYDEFAAHLGYRLYLTQAILPPVAQSGGQFCYQIDIANDGYAAPHKEIEAHIMLKNVQDGTVYSDIIPNMNSRLLQPGVTFPLKGSVTIPKSLSSGTYEVRLKLLHKATKSDNRYFILLANTGNVQEVGLRLNNLHRTITISSGGCSAGGFLMGGGGTSVGGIVTDRPGIDAGAGCSSKYTLTDGSFEHGASHWEQYSNGFTVRSSSHAPDGGSIIRVTDGGASQVLDFSSSPINEFYVSGYSRFTSHTSVSNSADYSIYCDLKLTDGNSLFGKHADFPTSGTSGTWHFRKLHVESPTPIQKATCYAMFRNGVGSADFDQFTLTTCKVTAAAGCAYSLKDGSFEAGSGWINYHDGYTTHSSSPQDGNHYVRVTNGAAEQKINFTGSSTTQFTLSGYSRTHSSASVSNPDDYSIYCDVIDIDDKEIYGFIARFSTSTSGWQKATLPVNSQRPIKLATCYAMFRNGHGQVDFDNFQIESCS